MKLWKYSGTFLTATGIIHTIYALFIGKDAFSEMLRNGLVNSIGENYSQGFAFWFLICGVMINGIPLKGSIKEALYSALCTL